MSYTLQNPLAYFPLPTKSSAAGLCKLYVGLIDTDPLTPANQVQVYAVQPDGSELAIPQPIQLSAGGVPQYNGSPVQLKINADVVSVKVTTSIGALVSYTPRWSAEVSAAALAAVDSTVQIGGVEAKSLGRKYRAIPFLEDFGAVGDGVTDDTAAIIAASNALQGKSVLGTDGAIYKVTSTINLKCDLLARNSTFKLSGSSLGADLNAAFYQTVPGKIQCSINGEDCDSVQYAIICDAGISIQKKLIDIDVSVSNIKNNNDTQQCIAVCVFKSSSSLINNRPLIRIRATVDGVTATSNGVIGDNGGAARGILVSMNGNGTDAQCVIYESDIKNISSGGAAPNEDADGIQTFQADYLSSAAKGLHVIRDCKVAGSRKRGIKVQTVNTTVTVCDVDGFNCEAAYETYSIGTTFENLKARRCTGTGITTTNAGTRITNCEVSVIGLFAGVRLYAGSADVSIDGGTKITSTSNYPNDIDYGLVEIDESVRPTIDNVLINSTSLKGTAILFKNGSVTGSKVSNVRVLNTVYGVASVNATGSVVISDSSIIVSGHGVYKIGVTPFLFNLSDCSIEAGLIPIYTKASGNESIVYADNLEIVSGSDNGVLVSDKSLLSNINLIKYGLKAAGYGILAGNSKVSNSTIQNFNVGIGYGFTTTAQIYCNATINCTTPYETTGFTPFVNHDNYSR